LRKLPWSTKQCIVSFPRTCSGCKATETRAIPKLEPKSEPSPEPSPEPVATLSMHRLYNPYSYEHFYTFDDEEFAELVELGWQDEGTGWEAPKSGDPARLSLSNVNN